MIGLNRGAANQVAGLAALAALRNLSPSLVSDRSLLLFLVARWICSMKRVGFMEYDGPDLGYLTVTMDCLWDLYDLTKNTEF